LKQEFVITNLQRWKEMRPGAASSIQGLKPRLNPQLPLSDDCKEQILGGRRRITEGSIISFFPEIPTGQQQDGVEHWPCLTREL
jgi:hypothetical protein